MKKIFILLSAIFIISMFIIISDQAHAVLLKFNREVSGKIVAVDLEAEKPTITVEYTEEDRYYRSELKRINLIIEEGTNIVDEAGEQLEKDNLNVGDVVSASYKIKYANNAIPLWKIATDITLTSSLEIESEK
ncbi:MAG: hypothetical protein KJ593_00950 [Candidatus Omnitrophica bacterium]|nr:hypothetical protein [Candidatus Omnitrophota bacterium]